MFNIYFEESSFTTIEINSAKMSTFTIKFFFLYFKPYFIFQWTLSTLAEKSITRLFCPENIEIIQNLIFQIQKSYKKIVCIEIISPACTFWENCLGDILTCYQN